MKYDLYTSQREWTLSWQHEYQTCLVKMGLKILKWGTNSQVYRCNDLEVTQMSGFLKIIKLIPKCSKSAQSSKKPFTLNTYPKYLGG